MQNFVTMHDSFSFLKIVIFIEFGPMHNFVTIFKIHLKRVKLSASLPSLGRLAPLRSSLSPSPPRFLSPPALVPSGELPTRNFGEGRRYRKTKGDQG